MFEQQGEGQEQGGGLMQAARTRAQPSQPSPADDGEDNTITGGLGEEPTPQDQDDYETVMWAAAEVMFSDETYPGIVKMLSDLADTPDEALAQTAVLVMGQLDDATEGGLPEEVLLTPVGEIIEQLGGIAMKEGLFHVDEMVGNAAAQLAVADLGETYGFDEQEVIAAMQQLPEGAGQAAHDYTQRFGAQARGDR